VGIVLRDFSSRRIRCKSDLPRDFTVEHRRLKNLAITPPADNLILLLAAPIAQLDRAADYGSAGYRFNSYWVHHLKSIVLSLLEL
jgi:hypothetical protein